MLTCCVCASVECAIHPGKIPSLALSTTTHLPGCEHDSPGVRDSPLDQDLCCLGVASQLGGVTKRRVHGKLEGVGDWGHGLDAALAVDRVGVKVCVDVVRPVPCFDVSLSETGASTGTIIASHRKGLVLARRLAVEDADQRVGALLSLAREATAVDGRGEGKVCVCELLGVLRRATFSENERCPRLFPVPNDVDGAVCFHAPEEANHQDEDNDQDQCDVLHLLYASVLFWRGRSVASYQCLMFTMPLLVEVERILK